MKKLRTAARCRARVAFPAPLRASHASQARKSAARNAASAASPPGATVGRRPQLDSMRDSEVAAHLGEVLWVSGDRDEARQIWEQGRKKDADNKVLIETIKRLAS